MNINEAVQRIKRVGASNVRIMPMDGQPALTGLHKIEVKDQGAWTMVIEGLDKSLAESIVQKAVSKVILG